VTIPVGIDIFKFMEKLKPKLYVQSESESDFSDFSKRKSIKLRKKIDIGLIS
jgi:hypothetical protein